MPSCVCRERNASLALAAAYAIVPHFENNSFHLLKTRATQHPVKRRHFSKDNPQTEESTVLSPLQKYVPHLFKMKKILIRIRSNFPEKGEVSH